MGRIINRFCVGLILLAMLSPALPGTAGVNVGNATGLTTQLGITPPIYSPLEALDFTLLGRFGGYSKVVEVQGNFAYLGIGYELAILDFSNPSNITRIGFVHLGMDITDLVVSSNIAYVIGSKSFFSEFYLLAVDISNPFSPQILGSKLIRHSPFSIWVDGQYAFIAFYLEGLGIYDLADPANFVEVGFFNAGELSFDATVHNGIAYLANGHGGVIVLDVSSPSNPIELSRIETYFAATGVMVYEDQLFIIDTRPWDTSFLWIIDISNPSAPANIVFYDPHLGPGGGRATSMVVYKTGTSTHLLISHSIHGLFLLDISDPFHPTVVDHKEGGGRDLYLHNNFVFFTRTGDNGLHVYELSPDGEVQFRGSYRAPIHLKVADAHGHYVYGMYYMGLFVIDASIPQNPKLINRLELPQASPIDMVIQNNFLYALVGGSFMTFSLANPSNPQPLGYLELPNLSHSSNMSLANNYAYITSDEGLLVVDVSQSDAPWLVTSYQGSFYKVTVDDGHAFLTGDNFTILDISDLSNIREVKRIQCYFGVITVEDGYAYLGMHYDFGACSKGLNIFDVTNPTEPEYAGFMEFEGDIKKIILKDKIAFLSTVGPNGIHAIELSKPFQPFIAGHYFLPHGLDDFAYSNGKIYAGILGDGLYILKFGSQITGRTLLRNLLPFGGAAVSAGPHSTSSDSHGRYRLSNLPSGFYHLEASYTSFGSWPYPHQVNASEDVMGQDLYIVPARKSELLDPVEPTVFTIIDPQNMQLTLEFQHGAVPAETPVTVVSIMAFPISGMAFAGHAFELLAHTLTFPSPVTATVEFSQADIAVISEPEGLALLYYSQDGWMEAAHTCPDPGNTTLDLEIGYLRLEVCRTGRYALFGPSHQVVLPFIFR
jgi:hypothetical protein